MNARTFLVWGFSVATLAAIACSSSSTGNTSGESDGGSSSGGSGSGSSSGTNGGCTGTAPQIQCDICGTTSSETAQCISGVWSCPEVPVHCAGSDDASVDSGGNGGTDAGSHTDGGFACAACSSQTNYCELSYGPPPNDGGSGVPSQSCEPLPECDAGASCACVTIGPFCTCADVAGAITVTCPFHP
ncbi:MAG: hypothetical protein ACLQVI_27660 [Polyangiaceae bacterium]|jgi:hypothetical protein